MANRPDHGAGFIPQGYGWMAALASAPLTQLERLVWNDVAYQWLGYAKRDAVLLSPADLGRRFGRSRGNVGTAIAGLVAKRMLRKLGPALYEPEGDPAAWEFDEDDAARGARLALISATPAYVRSIRALDPGSLPAPTQPATKQLSFLEEGDPPPAGLECSAIAERGRTATAERAYCHSRTERTAIAERGVLPQQNADPRAIEERPRGIEIKTDLKIFLDGDAGDTRGPEKKILFPPREETPQERAARFVAHKLAEQRGASDG